MESALTKATKELKSAAGDAFNQNRQLVGTPLNPDIIAYNRLKQPDFVEMIREFGQNATMEYIKRMEALRLGEMG